MLKKNVAEKETALAIATVARLDRSGLARLVRLWRALADGAYQL